MAFIQIDNVRIAGFSAAVPKNVISNLDADINSKDYTAEDFVNMTGVLERHISDNFTTSDLCYAAAERLISDLRWDKSEIGVLIFVSQTADYILPATSCILQDRLGLGKDTYALDISLGCSGWVYGLSNIASIISVCSKKKGLLMVGDAKPAVPAAYDPLFGYAGTVTAIEYVDNTNSLKFDFGTDGSGYDAIIIPDGGSRNQITSKSFELENVDGKMLHRLQSRMNGMDVFSFGISTAPKSVKKLSEYFGIDYDKYDYYVFHQANMKMNNMIVKKLKLNPDKVPLSMYHYGNTSSASIPLTIVTQLRNNIEHKLTHFICCGFGVGLSWGTAAFDTNNIVISELIEL